MPDQTKKQKKISAKMNQEVANIKAAKAARSASTSSPGSASSGYKSNSIAGNSPVGRRKIGKIKSANGIGGTKKAGKSTKGGSGIKKMIAAKNYNPGCGAGN